MNDYVLGFTLLQVAALHGNADAVETLIKAGANVNHENELGKKVYYLDYILIKDGKVKKHRKV